MKIVLCMKNFNSLVHIFVIVLSLIDIFFILLLLQLELQFEDRSMQFTVSPLHAVIIMQFQEETR